jgi:hypothetical protein
MYETIKGRRPRIGGRTDGTQDLNVDFQIFCPREPLIFEKNETPSHFQQINEQTQTSAASTMAAGNTNSSSKLSAEEKVKKKLKGKPPPVDKLLKPAIVCAIAVVAYQFFAGIKAEVSVPAAAVCYGRVTMLRDEMMTLL